MALVTTPLRYPGGKSGLTNYLRLVQAANNLRGGHYVEPYCGGAGAAVALLRAEAVSSIHINDLDPAVFSFWMTLVLEPHALIDFVLSVPLTVDEWRRHRAVYSDKSSKRRDRARAFLYLNRVNRSGILNAGLIGGLRQTGKWLMDARFNREDIAARIDAIAAFRESIFVYNLDALSFLRTNNRLWPRRTLIYLDPPYFEKGQCLYRNAYVPSDHSRIAAYLRTLTRRCWLASYDSAPEIIKLYSGLSQREYSLDYTARSRRVGREVLIFGSGTLAPDVRDPMRVEKSLIFSSATLGDR